MGDTDNYDYYIDEYGEFVCRCHECTMNPYRDDED